MSSSKQAGVGLALVNFAVDSTFPDDEDVISANVDSLALPAALELLDATRTSLKNHIQGTSREVAPDVDSWISNAKTLQSDIDSSKRLANEIIRQAEADEQRDDVLNEQTQYLVFLENEAAFNDQLGEALLLIQEIHERLDQVETCVHAGKILEALHLLHKSWDSLVKIPTSRTAQVVRLLDARCFDLKETAEQSLRTLWSKLIVVDRDKRNIMINRNLEGEATNIDDALVSLKAYKQLEIEAKHFWDCLDSIILSARTNLDRQPLRSIHIQDNTIQLGDDVVGSDIASLFIDIEAVIRFLVAELPADFIEPLSDAMMPNLSRRIKEVWLDTAVPSSLDDMVEYQKSLAQVLDFVEKLQSLSWPGADIFREWITDAPKVWINKKREISLDWTRNHLALGVGLPQNAQHFERHTVDRDQGKQLASTGTMVSRDWNAAWNSYGDELSSDEEPLEQASSMGGINRASLEEARQASRVSSPLPSTPTDAKGDDDWGWGEEVTLDEPLSQDIVEPPQAENTAPRQNSSETHEVTLSESFKISSFPARIFETIAGIFNDGARLTSPAFEHVPVTPAAPILFSLPTLVLAMYRSISPHFYSKHPRGNMFTYNDSIYLMDRLEEFQFEWDKRTDLNSRAIGKVKLASEIKIIGSFGKRAYTNELNTQRTVITDLLGGSQNFFQEDGSFKGDLEADIEGVVKYIRTVAASWKPILAYSAWASSVGALVNSAASKLIADVFDLTNVSADDALRIATLISIVEGLDDLFYPAKDPHTKQSKATNGNDSSPVPMTSRFVDRWLQLQYLSQIFQSNLVEIKYLWFESELSLEFTADEVEDLIWLSFESNPNSRQTVKEIKANPRPKIA